MSSQKQVLQSERERLVLSRRREIELGSEDQAQLASALTSKSAELTNLTAQFRSAHQYKNSAIKTLQVNYERIPYLKEIYSWRLARPLRWIARKLLGSWNERALRTSVARWCAGELGDFLASRQRLVFRTVVSPRVTVILVLHDWAELTFAALRSLMYALRVPAQVIIVDNGPRDLTSILCSRIEGAQLFRKENLHFVDAVHQAAASANGEIILLLNDGICIQPDAIRVACEILGSEPDVGAVGGKILRLDGALQEAGGIVFQDGTLLGYGRGHNPRAAEFQFRRNVDYCSGALLFVRRSLFEELGHFSGNYATAYYHDIDLCMRIWAAGYRVVYAPSVEGTLFEFAGPASAKNALVRQERDRTIFRNRHRARLNAYYLPAGWRLLEARTRNLTSNRILVIDDRIPYPYLGSGCPRANSMLQTIHSLGWFVTFYPLIHPAVNWNQAYDLLPPEMEIIADLGVNDLQDFLSERVGYYKAVLVSRPHNMQYFCNAARNVPKFLETTKLIYDAEAVFAVRDALRLALKGIPISIDDMKNNLASEIALSADAAMVLAVSEREARLFRPGKQPVQIVGHSIMLAPTSAAFSERSDILFVGALDDDESPNSDAIRWFVHEVISKLDVLLGTDYKLRIVGRNSSSVQALSGRRVEVLGVVDDLQPVYNSARLCIAPIRFAAGLSMKVHSAAAAGVPVVSTQLVAEQLDWHHDVEIMTADEPEAFAAACHQLYTNPILWHRLRCAALGRVSTDCSPAEFNSRLETVLAAVAPPYRAS